MIKCKFKDGIAILEDFTWYSKNKKLESFLNDTRNFNFRLPQYANPEVLEAKYKVDTMDGEIIEDTTKDFKREDGKIY